MGEERREQGRGRRFIARVEKGRGADFRQTARLLSQLLLRGVGIMGVEPGAIVFVQLRRVTEARAFLLRKRGKGIGAILPDRRLIDEEIGVDTGGAGDAAQKVHDCLAVDREIATIDAHMKIRVLVADEFGEPRAHHALDAKRQYCAGASGLIADNDDQRLDRVRLSHRPQPRLDEDGTLIGRREAFRIELGPGGAGFGYIGDDCEIGEGPHRRAGRGRRRNVPHRVDRDVLRVDQDYSFAA
jgi:hypothetical protein